MKGYSCDSVALPEGVIYAQGFGYKKLRPSSRVIVKYHVNRIDFLQQMDPVWSAVIGEYYDERKEWTMLSILGLHP